MIIYIIWCISSTFSCLLVQFGTLKKKKKVMYYFFPHPCHISYTKPHVQLICEGRSRNHDRLGRWHSKHCKKHYWGAKSQTVSFGNKTWWVWVMSLLTLTRYYGVWKFAELMIQILYTYIYNQFSCAFILSQAIQYPRKTPESYRTQCISRLHFWSKSFCVHYIHP